jgi:hypothetical protein
MSAFFAIAFLAILWASVYYDGPKGPSFWGLWLDAAGRLAGAYILLHFIIKYW